MLKYIIALLLITFNITANDLSVSQHNFKLSSGDFGMEIREMLNTRKDHIQIGYNGITNLSLEYRYADAEQTENRIRATYDTYTWKWVSLSSRFEQRIFEDDGMKFRFRQIVDIEVPLKERVALWVEFQPGLTLNKMTLDTQTRLGIAYKIKSNVVITPFIQMNTNKDFDRQTSWFGTTLKIDF